MIPRALSRSPSLCLFHTVIPSCSINYLYVTLLLGLSTSPKDVKALYRRCQAYQALGEVEKSYTDAVAVKRLEPGNKAVEDIFVSCDIAEYYLFVDIEINQYKAIYDEQILSCLFLTNLELSFFIKFNLFIIK